MCNSDINSADVWAFNLRHAPQCAMSSCLSGRARNSVRQGREHRGLDLWGWRRARRDRRGEARTMIYTHGSGNVCKAPGLACWLLLSCSLTAIYDHSSSSFIHSFPPSFTHSWPNTCWCLQHSRQRCFCVLGLLWKDVGLCTATALPMFRSQEPETASWRILATGSKWAPPLQ